MKRTGPAVVAVVLAACGSGSEPTTPAPVARVAITGDTLVLMEGSSPLQAAVTDRAGSVLTDRVVTWTTLTPDVATVNAAGTVSGVKLGYGRISATSEGISDTINVRVIPRIAFSPRLPSLFAGDTAKLTATLVTATGRPVGSAAVEWSASSGGTVNANGIVSGATPGFFQVTARSGGGMGTVDVAVIRLPGRITRKVAWVEFEYTGETYYRGSVWVADPDGSSAVQVSPPDIHVLGYRWSPNGDRLAIIAQSLDGSDSKLYIVSPSGALLLTIPTVYGWAPAWSPDGSTIAFSDGTAIQLVGTNGGAPRRILMGLDGYVGGPEWAPDGRTISSTSDACERVAIVDSDGTHLRYLDIPHPTCTALISPDGKMFAYTVYTGPGGMYGDMGVLLAPTWGGAVTAASPNCMAGPPCSSPYHQLMEWMSDGYSIAERSLDYKRYDRRTGTTTSFGQPDGGPFVWGWSPDESKVIGYTVPGAPTDLKARLIVWDANFTSWQYITPADRDANWASWQPAP